MECCEADNKVILRFMPSWVEHNLYTAKGEKYSIVHIPENVMDCGDLCIYMKDRINDKIITLTMNAAFEHGSDIKLARDGKVVKTVKAEDLAECLENLYFKEKDERER